MSSVYLKLFLDSPLGNKLISSAQQGGAIMNISYKDLACLEIPVPSIAEQEKVAKEYIKDKAAACVQRLACRSPKLFLAIVFSIVISCFSLNAYRVVKICNRPKAEQTTTVVSQQEQLLKEKRINKTINNITNDTDRP